MTDLADLRRALEGIPAVDHHAHLLSGRGATWGLVDLLSESRDPEQRSAVRHHVAYRWAVRDLAAALEVAPDEESLARAARERDFEAHARQLLSACGLDAMLVDDGFPVEDGLDLVSQSKLTGCPVRRVVRIEAVAEAAALDVAGAKPPVGFALVRDSFRTAISGAVDDGAAALKTIAAYRCGLDLPRPDAGEAAAAYAHWRRSDQRRLAHPALISFFIAEALDVMRERREAVPLQVHTGIGDADLDLHRADPTLLGWLIEDTAAASVPVVLLHCYPFVAQAGWLASVYPHVFVDVSLAMLLAPHRGADLILEALDLAPATKLLFATDASRAPEMFFLAARWWRHGLAAALHALNATGSLDDDAVLDWARLILAGNARRLYGL
jgi:uncharacterized protein